MPRPLLPADPKSILLVRLSARGDVLLASPIIKALRKRYPSAHIAWAVETHAKDFIAHHPDLDELIVWDRAEWKAMMRKWQWRRLLYAFRDLRRRLRSRSFDVALDLQGLLRSGWIVKLSGAPVRVGLGSKEGSWLFMTRTVPRYGPVPGGTSLQYPYFAERLGLERDPFQLELTVDGENESFARRFIDERMLIDGYAVVCPFTTRDQKHWYEDRWGLLIARIRDQLGLPVVLLGGPADRAAAKRLGTLTDGPMIDMVGETSLSEAAAIVRHAALFIGVDTGLTHVSVAFERPSVLLFGSNIPYDRSPHANARIVLHMQPCAPCGGHPTCRGAYWCMQAITEDEVFAEAKSVLGAVK